MRIGDELVVDVDAIADGPDALCRVDGYVVFVAGALPGERLRVRVTSANRKFARAELIEVLESSPDRVAPRCRHFGECGGCDLQHIAHPAQLRIKTERLQKTLEHALGRGQLPIEPMAGPEDPWQQRTKIALCTTGFAGNLRAGLFRRRSRSVVPIRECPVQDPLALGVAFAIRDAMIDARLEPWDPRTDRGLVRAIVVRSAPASGQALATLVLRRDALPRVGIAAAAEAAGATGFAVDVNDGPPERLLGRVTHGLSGAERMSEEIHGIRYVTSSSAFFQTSRWGAAWLAQRIPALVAAPPDARVLDLYCGGGLLTLALARRAREVVGIDDNRQAIADAVASARENGIDNATFRAGRVGEALRGLDPRAGRPFAVVLDPPRAGCEPRVLDRIARSLRPDRVVYVSCDPGSLGRDAAALERSGYRLDRVEPLDMFPHSHHIEAIAVFERRLGGKRVASVAMARRLLARASGERRC